MIRLYIYEIRAVVPTSLSAIEVTRNFLLVELGDNLSPVSTPTLVHTAWRNNARLGNWKIDD